MIPASKKVWPHCVISLFHFLHNTSASLIDLHQICNSRDINHLQKKPSHKFPTQSNVWIPWEHTHCNALCMVDRYCVSKIFTCLNNLTRNSTTVENPPIVTLLRMGKVNFYHPYSISYFKAQGNRFKSQNFRNFHRVISFVLLFHFLNQLTMKGQLF